MNIGIVLFVYLNTGCFSGRNRMINLVRFKSFEAFVCSTCTFDITEVGFAGLIRQAKIFHVLDVVVSYA